MIPQALGPQKTIWQVSSIAQSAKNHPQRREAKTGQ